VRCWVRHHAGALSERLVKAAQCLTMGEQVGHESFRRELIFAPPAGFPATDGREVLSPNNSRPRNWYTMGEDEASSGCGNFSEFSRSNFQSSMSGKRTLLRSCGTPT